MQPHQADPNRLSWLAAALQTERLRFTEQHPRSVALSERAQQHFLFGVPLHWMRDWPTPSTLFVARAQGAELTCVDGHTLIDWCLGDTGAMFGHSPTALAEALATQARQGLTCMLPSALAVSVGEHLSQVFGLPLWQLALSASDANRFLVRWARAVTGRPQLLVFDGCYHGAVDDTLVDLDTQTGQTTPRPSVLGQVHNHHGYTRVVPFNNLNALEAALADQQVAALLAEPALTNCGLVPPVAGFWEQAQALCQRHGTLLLMDETHTLSTGPGGYCRAHGLQPDALVVGKAVAGGLPCAVYGFSAGLGERMQRAKTQAPEGHSGIGTTLSANLYTLAALEAALAHLHTRHNYQSMLAGAEVLQHGFEETIHRAGLPWTITRLGARLELQFMDHTPIDAQDVRDHSLPELESHTHLFMLNRGVLLTPFHCMLLVSPATTAHHINHTQRVFEELVFSWQEAANV